MKIKARPFSKGFINVCIFLFIKRYGFKALPFTVTFNLFASTMLLGFQIICKQ